jgi:hypothetical protein
MVKKITKEKVQIMFKISLQSILKKMSLSLYDLSFNLFSNTTPKDARGRLTPTKSLLNNINIHVAAFLMFSLNQLLH